MGSEGLINKGETINQSSSLPNLAAMQKNQMPFTPHNLLHKVNENHVSVRNDLNKDLSEDFTQ